MSNELSRQQPSADRPPEDANESTQQFVFTPPIDIHETPDGLILRADLPGVSLETLDLQVQNNKLTLFGRVSGADPEGAQLIHQEYREGDYLRSFILSENVDHDRISAKINSGVLEVFLPHAPKTEPRRIEVTGS
jgi:HSP20 family protein